MVSSQNTCPLIFTGFSQHQTIFRYFSSPQFYVFHQFWLNSNTNMGLFSRKFDASTYEQELDSLEEQLNQTQARLLRLDVTGRRIKRKLLVWGSAVWVALFLYSWLSQRLHQGDLWILSHLVAIPALVVALILLNNRLFTWLKSRQRSRRLQLQKRKKAKIDELKKATNFTSTSELLSKFEGNLDSSGVDKGNLATSEVKNKASIKGNGQGSGASGTSVVPNGAQGVAGPVTQNFTQFRPGTGPIPISDSGINQGQSGSVPGPEIVSSGAFYSSQFSTVDPNKRTVGDRILDFIIGSENGLLEDRYALICSSCYAHNGLAPPGVKDPLSVRYLCPKCGFANGKASLGESEVAPEVEEQEVAKLKTERDVERAAGRDEGEKKTEIGKEAAEVKESEEVKRNVL